VDNFDSNRPIDKNPGGKHADGLWHLPVEAFERANTQDVVFKKSLSIFGRNAEQDEMRGTIQEGNGDALVVVEHNGE
jgi:hypothetical protein